MAVSFQREHDVGREKGEEGPEPERAVDGVRGRFTPFRRLNDRTRSECENDGDESNDRDLRGCEPIDPPLHGAPPPWRFARCGRGSWRRFYRARREHRPSGTRRGARRIPQGNGTELAVVRGGVPRRFSAAASRAAATKGRSLDVTQLGRVVLGLAVALLPAAMNVVSEERGTAPPGGELRLPADIVFDRTVGPDGAVVFRHTTHHAFAGEHCTVCHPEPFRMLQPARKTGHAEMDEGRSCGICHDGQHAFSTKDQGSCASCHEAWRGGPAGSKASGSGPTGVPACEWTHSADPAPTAARAPRETLGAAPTTDARPRETQSAAPATAVREDPRTHPLRARPAAVGSNPPASAASARVPESVGRSPQRMQAPAPRDVPLLVSGGSPGPVVFRHRTHAGGELRCTDCHPDEFAMKAGTTAISGPSEFHERKCGSCHNGKTAFGVDDSDQCVRCHNMPGEGT